MSLTASSFTRWILPAACAALLVAACGGTPDAASAGTSGSATSPTPASSNGVIAEDLTFTGALAGHMTSGHRGDTYVCTGGGSSFVAGPIVGDVGGKEVSLNITKISFHGAGSYPAGGVSFDVNGDHYYPSLGAQGALVVASDLRSGSLDVDLAVNADPSTVVGHVSGTWRCPPDAF